MDWSDMVIGIVVAVIVLVIGTYLADLPKLRKIVGWLLIVCAVVLLAAIAYVMAWRLDLSSFVVRLPWDYLEAAGIPAR
jgi:predicted Abi (CAAX) family protease